MKKILSIILALVLCACAISFVACNDGNSGQPENSIGNAYVQYVADGNQAATLLSSGKVDFIVVGEPAASAQKNRLSLNAELNMQTAYAEKSGASNYPQAGIFVKSALAGDESFMSALFTALQQNKNWVADNKANVTAEAKKLYESAVFPAVAVPRCAINGTKLDENGRADVLTFLKNVMPKDAENNAIDWDACSDKLFDVVSSIANDNLRFAAPEGTPALAMLTLATNNQKIDGKTVEYEVVSPSNIASEMAAGKSDIVIMPVNAGANLIRQGKDYKLVSVAVDGSLYMVGNTADGGEISFGDLVGKKIACIGKSATPGLVFRYVMKANGITLEDID